MSGIDRQGQMSSYYPRERKTLGWYKKNRNSLFSIISAKFLLNICRKRKETMYSS